MFGHIQPLTFDDLLFKNSLFKILSMHKLLRQTNMTRSTRLVIPIKNAITLYGLKRFLLPFTPRVTGIKSHLICIMETTLSFSKRCVLKSTTKKPERTL